MRGWIRRNMKIGPVLDVKVRYNGVEIMIESLFRDRTTSRVRIVNRINKHVTETPEEIPVASVGERGTGKLVTKARPRPTPTLTLSPVSVLFSERRWIDIEPDKFSQGCFEVSKFMIRLLWYGTHVSKPNGEWNKTAEVMMLNFAESGHPASRATSALERREFEKAKEKK